MDASNFSLSLQGRPQPLPVRSFRATERINAVGGVRLICSGLEEVGEEHSLLGKTGTLVVAGAESGPRAFHGMVTRQEQLSPGGFKLWLEPRMAWLAQSSMWRIFHGLDALGVVEQILREHRVPFRRRIARKYAARPHITQRGESDLVFVKRLLAEEGIFFFIDHPEVSVAGVDETNMGSTEIVVLCDGAAGYSPILQGAPFRAIAEGDQTQPGDDRVLLGYRDTKRIKPAHILKLSRDFQRPIRPIASDSRGDNPATGFPEQRRAFRYEHDGNDEDRPRVEAAAQLRLDAARASAQYSEASSVSPQLMPGRLIRVEPLAGAPRDLVVVELRHEGKPAASQEQLSYQAQVSFAPADSPQRPSRQRRRRVHGLESATVVGPVEQEIHTDEHGRVQVRFHWDLEQAEPLAWLRVSQPWGGAGYGASFLPRVGSEVLVAYVDGDPDRPIVMGNLHHPAQPSPLNFPHQATQSGIRTRSSPGGAGYNELIFDDQAGAERVSLRSQDKLSLESLGDTAMLHGGDVERRVAGSDQLQVEGAAHERIAGHKSAVVGGDRVDHVAGSHRSTVLGDVRREVQGSSLESLRGLVLTQVHGSRQTMVGVGDEAGDEVLSAARHVSLSAGDSIELRAQKRIVLRCGASSIELTPDAVTIESDLVITHSHRRSELQHGPDRAVGFAYDGTIAFSADKIILASSAGSSLVLDADAALDGALVKLNCGGSGAGGSGEPGLVDEQGDAVFRLDPAGVTPGGPFTFVIAAPDGAKIAREIEPGGEVRLQGRPGERFSLIEVLRDGQKIATRKPEGSR